MLDEVLEQHYKENELLEKINLENKNIPITDKKIISLRKKICDLRNYLRDNPIPPPMVDNNWSRFGYENSINKLNALERQLCVLTEKYYEKIKRKSSSVR